MTRSPLSQAVTLSQGVIDTREFRAYTDHWDYEIDLRFDPKFADIPLVSRLLVAKANPFPAPVDDRLLQATTCLLGAESHSDQCADLSPLIGVSWDVYERQNIVAHGNSDRFDHGLEEYGDSILRTIGMFRAQKGHRYHLVAHVNRDASELDVTNPRLLVQIPVGYQGDVMMANEFRMWFAAIMALVGLSLVLAGIRRHRQRRGTSL